MACTARHAARLPIPSPPSCVLTPTHWITFLPRQLHGARRKRSWTKLNATVPLGNDTIALAEDVDWAPGDHLVIASSETDMHQNEEVGLATQPAWPCVAVGFGGLWPLVPPLRPV